MRDGDPLGDSFGEILGESRGEIPGDIWLILLKAILLGYRSEGTLLKERQLMNAIYYQK